MHSSHFEVLAENGFFGIAIWLGLFGYSIVVLLRVRRRAARDTVPEDERYFLVSSSNALLVSLVAFLVGGSFIALSLNDLTWYTFSFVAALDRLSQAPVLVDSPFADASPDRTAFSPTAGYLADPRSSLASR